MTATSRTLAWPPTAGSRDQVAATNPAARADGRHQPESPTRHASIRTRNRCCIGATGLRSRPTVVHEFFWTALHGRCFRRTESSSCGSDRLTEGRARLPSRQMSWRRCSATCTRREAGIRSAVTTSRNRRRRSPHSVSLTLTRPSLPHALQPQAAAASRPSEQWRERPLGGESVRGSCACWPARIG